MDNRKLEDPKKQFRGWWIPVEIVTLLENKEIKPSELVLLATIDSLVSEDKGCYASNEYLAKRLNISEWTISTMITKLEEKGLIINVAFDGRQRYLETPWSRIDLSKVENDWLKNRLVKTQKQTLGFHEADFGETQGSLVKTQSRMCNTQDNTQNNKQESGEQSSHPTPPKQEKDSSSGQTNRVSEHLNRRNGHTTVTNGQFNLPGDELPKKKSRLLLLSEKFYDELKAKRKVTKKVNLGKWVEDFKKFIIESEGVTVTDLEMLTSKYIHHIEYEWMPKVYYKIDDIAKNFCDNYVKITERCREAASKAGLNGHTKKSKTELAAESLKEKILNGQ